MMVSFPIPIESWSPFPLENIPFGIFSTEVRSFLAQENSTHPEPINFDFCLQGNKPRAGTAVGDWVVDLFVLEQHGLFSSILEPAEHIFDKVISHP